MDRTDMDRTGLSLAPSNQISLGDMIELVRLADDLGYHSVWVPETWGFDSVPILALLARETRRMKLASGVFNVYSRSAALIAQSAATLQALSGGRFLLGLGASGPGVIEPWHGIPYRRPIERTRDYVNVIRLALSGARVDYDGDQLHLKGFTLAVPPPAPVPIYIAALGPRNVRLSGEIADGWLPIFAARGQMIALFEQLARGAHAAGRDPASIDVAAYLPGLFGERAERLLRQQIAYYVGGMGTFYFEFVSALGFQSEARTIRERWEAGDRVAAVNAVDPRLLDLCTLGTDPDGARERLAAYRDDGVRLPVLTLPHGCSREEAEATIRGLAPES